MRAAALTMAISLFAAPQIITTKSIISLYAECGSQAPPIIEEEEVRHACDWRCDVHTPAFPDDLTVLMHQYEEGMLDHPVVEVPHQPPKVS